VVERLLLQSQGDGLGGKKKGKKKCGSLSKSEDVDRHFSLSIPFSFCFKNDWFDSLFNKIFSFVLIFLL
jgi:hypothetical protein